MRFTLMPLSWFKRRWPTEVEPKVTEFEVIGFEKIDNSYCDLMVKLDNGECHRMSARVSMNITNIVGGTYVINGWTVQGINTSGLSVLLRLNDE